MAHDDEEEERMETETRTKNPEAAATRLDRLRERVEAEIEEMVEAALEAHREAEAEAEAKVSRWEQATVELKAARRKLAALEEELDRLPLEAYTANLDGNSELEEQLRRRYTELREGEAAEIPELEARIVELERETEAAYDHHEARRNLDDLRRRREGLEAGAARLPGTVDLAGERLRDLEAEATREAVATRAEREKPGHLAPLRENLGRLRRDLDGIVDEAIGELRR